MYTLEVFGILQVHLLSAIAACLIARFKNRDAGMWFFFSFFPLSIFGPLVLAWLPNLCEKCGYPIRKGYKACLKCKE